MKKVYVIIRYSEYKREVRYMREINYKILKLFFSILKIKVEKV